MRIKSLTINNECSVDRLASHVATGWVYGHLDRFGAFTPETQPAAWRKGTTVYLRRETNYR